MTGTDLPIPPLNVGPDRTEIAQFTDRYFDRTAQIVSRFGDVEVRYAVFLRRPARCAIQPAVDWLERTVPEVRITRRYREGEAVGAGDPLMLLQGSLSRLVGCETVLLQLVGAPCVATDNAYAMCCSLPNTQFVAMEARHCCGTQMNALMTYGAAVGGRAASQEQEAVGFVGSSVPRFARIFNTRAIGTMPHVLIGYAGSTVRAAQMYAEAFPGKPLTVLVDYFGAEITDALAVCRQFSEQARAGQLAIRLDTNGSRYVQGLDPSASYAVLEANVPNALRRYLSAAEQTHLVGPGVSAAAVWLMRTKLDAAGYPEVRIVASGGFDPQKCRSFAWAQAPVDMIGTGNFLPSSWPETYATADAIAFDGVKSVKAGREYLLGYNDDLST